ncbi:hypothetical protein [Amycolatopsis sp. A1MSW2902]
MKPGRPNRWLRDELVLAREDQDLTGCWKHGVVDFGDEHDHPR